MHGNAVGRAMGSYARIVNTLTPTTSLAHAASEYDWDILTPPITQLSPHPSLHFNDAPLILVQS